MKPGLLLACFFVFLILTKSFANDSTKIIPQDSTQKVLQNTQSQQKIGTTTPSKKNDDWTKTATFWVGLFSAFVTASALFFGIYQYRMRRKDAQENITAGLEAKEKFTEQKAKTVNETNVERYNKTLEKELGTIKIMGSPDIENIPVKLMDTFVHLKLSHTYRSENRFKENIKPDEMFEDRSFTPKEIMARAFKQCKMLLIIGDPGSGKTTLVKYYALTNIEQKKRAGMTFYLPLRDLKWNDGEIDSLHNNLAYWASKHHLEISAEIYYDWLHTNGSLVLLDGLDEIGDVDHRKKVCAWIDKTNAGIDKAKIVVTSRWTGYRKADGIELEAEHLRADVKDFIPEQQEDFLQKWLKAAYSRELPPPETPDVKWRHEQELRAKKRADEIITFLNKKENKRVQELAVVPMLLQIMAIIWKERDFIPKNRNDMYNSSLNYLLEFRDQRRNINPLLTATDARSVLAPVSLWMQEDLKADEAPKDQMHTQMKKIIDMLIKRPSPEDLCKNLIERAGILAEYSPTEYVFRHKSFREFLAGLQLIKDAHRPMRISKLVENFGKDWWEESIRFFMSQADGAVFDKFMETFFESDKSLELTQEEQNLLQTIIEEAPQKKTDALAKKLNDPKPKGKRQYYILGCLRKIDTPQTWDVVNKFIKKKNTDKRAQQYAEEILAVSGYKKDIEPGSQDIIKNIPSVRPQSFRNPFEQEAQYILIPGGSYKYKVKDEKVDIPDIYFAKYPLTNKRYRRFIAYLQDRNDVFASKLALNTFAEKLLEFIGKDEDYKKYLSPDPNEWAERLKSYYENDKRFKQDDQPVNGISWYAARTYCFWLSMLETSADNKKDFNINEIANKYRLPTEWEWLWAAAGREKDGSLREYPWSKENGGPTDKLANYKRNVGATTPVERYPDGSTAEGLHDMAGNVWEWMDNEHEKYKGSRALRGGSWVNKAGYLRCSARNSDDPSFRYIFIGFRVVRLVNKTEVL